MNHLDIKDMNQDCYKQRKLTDSAEAVSSVAAISQTQGNGYHNE